jgi:hypothetical protein
VTVNGKEKEKKSERGVGGGQAVAEGGYEF